MTTLQPPPQQQPKQQEQPQQQQQPHFFPAPQIPNSGDGEDDEEGGFPQTTAVPRMCPGAGACCVLEMSATRLYRYRTYTVLLSLRRAWRLEHALTPLNVFDALLSARCCLLGTSTAASCPRCKCARVVELSGTSHEPAYHADTDVEVYSCGLQSRCTSSRDHLKSALMLLIDTLPTPAPILSFPFVLYARDKQTKAAKAAAAKAAAEAAATVRPSDVSTAHLEQQQQKGGGAQGQGAGVAEHTFSLFKRPRHGDPAEEERAPAGADEPGAAEAFPETYALIAQHAGRTRNSGGDSNCDAAQPSDRTQLLPEAFVSSFLLNGRTGFTGGAAVPAPQQQGEEKKQQQLEDVVQPVIDTTAPPPTAAETEADAEEGYDGNLVGLACESPSASYFDGPFSSYPRGVHAFTAFQMSPTLLDIPPYSSLYSMP